jgi:spermidine synthase
MTLTFEELDYQKTPLGDISLRRRVDPRLGGEIIYEVKLNDEFLMSSLFALAEVQLAKLALATQDGTALDVVVGGLGLGYTAVAALAEPVVRSLMVVEVLAAVIDWHQMGLVPCATELIADPRCSLVQEDFFKLASSDHSGFDRRDPKGLVHAILLDIDHSPSHWLNPTNGLFYTQRGLSNLADKLHPGGVFAMWSNEPPNEKFTSLLGSVLNSCQPHTVRFSNPYSDGVSTNTVYVACKEIGSV